MTFRLFKYFQGSCRETIYFKVPFSFLSLTGKPLLCGHGMIFRHTLCVHAYGILSARNSRFVLPSVPSVP